MEDDYEEDYDYDYYSVLEAVDTVDHQQLLELTKVLLENYSLLCTFLVESGKTEDDFVKWKDEYFKRTIN